MEKKTNTQTAKNRKNLKKVIIISLSVVLVICLLGFAADLVLKYAFPEEDTRSYTDWAFFVPDYDKNILEDELYLSLNRRIYYNQYGTEQALTAENIVDMPASATLFYNYFDCLVRGDYQTYPSFYTEECLNDPDFNCPETFTMQAIYDIHVILHSSKRDEATGTVTEYYEVSYRIFENNGTYRRDILPDETRTRVFEIITVDGEAKINSIGYRQTKD